MQPYQAALIALGAVIGLLLVIVLVMGGGNLSRWPLACQAFSRVLRDADFASRVQTLLQTAPSPPKAAVKPVGDQLQFLAILQREGRLLDFLLEDIQSYPDAQIGAAVRDIHRQCRDALKEHLVLDPVLPQPEGATVAVPAGFDPSAIRLTGNVTGQPPFHGTLQHHGWRAREVKLPPRPEGQDERILMPAEVELT